MAWQQVRLLQSKQAVVCSLVVQWLRIWLPLQGTRVRIPGLGESHMPLSNQVHELQLLNLLHSRAHAPQEKPP